MERKYYLIVLINIIIFLIIAIVLLVEAYSFKTHKKPVKPRLVWPEDLPDGDRIREQMVYVPFGYQYEKAPIKRILMYTGVGSDSEEPKLGQEEFAGCPVSRCSLTMDTSYGPEVDAVLFKDAYTHPEFKRPPNQIWILSHSGSPLGKIVSSDADADAFNWTSTYRRDSDLPQPYGYFWQDVRMGQKPRTIGTDHVANKTKQVAWFVFNCDVHDNRSAYADELAKHIPVDVYDVYGDCGLLKCPWSTEDRCFRMLEDDYKFYLAFEDAHCRQYITEKFFVNALSHNVLPIVMGPRRSDYELVAPKHSFIHVDDFESPKLLAEYLKMLDIDDKEYNEYFEWKDTGTIVNDTKYYCRLCAMLHDERHSSKHYEDINEWWMGHGVCER